MLAGLVNLTESMNYFMEESAGYLTTQNKEEYYGNEGYDDLNQAINRVARIRLDLIQILRRLE